MELKPYQSRVLQDIDHYFELVDKYQNYVQAFTIFWNEKGLEV